MSKGNEINNVPTRNGNYDLMNTPDSSLKIGTSQFGFKNSTMSKNPNETNEILMQSSLRGIFDNHTNIINNDSSKNQSRKAFELQQSNYSSVQSSSLT